MDGEKTHVDGMHIMTGSYSRDEVASNLKKMEDSSLVLLCDLVGSEILSRGLVSKETHKRLLEEAGDTAEWVSAQLESKVQVRKS